MESTTSASPPAVDIGRLVAEVDALIRQLRVVGEHLAAAGLMARKSKHYRGPYYRAVHSLAALHGRLSGAQEDAA